MPLFSLRRGTALNPAFEHLSPGVCSAYNICCRAEQYVIHDPACIPDSKKREATLVYIRLLGYMLTPWFTNDDMVVATVVTAITSSQRSDPADEVHVEGNSIDITALSELGQFYVNFLIRPFRKFKGRTPVTSTHPSRPSFELSQEQVRAMLAEAPTNYSSARTLAMRREGYRCILSRFIDLGYYVDHGVDTTNTAVKLEFCHIFSESTNAGLQNARKATNAWAVLKSFGYTQIVKDLATANNVHSLENVMMMDSTLHHHFDTLSLWLEPVAGTLHRYRIVHVAPLHTYNLPDEVVFTSREPHLPLPLPSPEYLRIHAACCRISWLSGASGLFYKLEQDMEEDPDPATEMPAFADLLYTRLEHVSIIQA
ncbi:hypothetical protein C8Q74DRAFT_1372570 [Fomes fomentarius]|nr:hypothetical protein C8Q74DRAFT_1372570 [Fomes fomentarius]